MGVMCLKAGFLKCRLLGIRGTWWWRFLLIFGYLSKACAYSLSHVRLFVTLLDCSPPGSSVHGIFSDKNIGVGCHVLLQGLFPIQRSDPALLYCRQILYHLSHQGSQRILEYLAYPFSRESSWHRNWTGIQTGVSCNSGRLLPSCVTREALYVCKLCISLNLFTFTVFVHL